VSKDILKIIDLDADPNEVGEADFVTEQHVKPPEDCPNLLLPKPRTSIFIYTRRFRLRSSVAFRRMLSITVF
jgi:hypothetical protein